MSFDHLAPFYRGMEFVLAGGKLQRCRLEWLEEVKDSRQVLIVGEGPGRFLMECAKTLPDAQILCVDASAAMLSRAITGGTGAGEGTVSRTMWFSSTPILAGMDTAPRKV